MSSPILITGGTGTLGRHVTALLRDGGHKVRVLCRHHHAPDDGIEYVTHDLLQPHGLAEAVQGAEIVVHLAGGRKGDDTATTNLVRAVAAVGRPHLVHISVIAVDRMPIGWFRSKLRAEQAVTGSGLPWTVLRAAQFHEFVQAMAQSMAKLPVIPVPGGLRLEPVDSRDVAERLVELACGVPAGLVPDLAGPNVYPMAELLHGYLRAAGRRRATMPVRMPGKAGHAYRCGDNLTLDGVTLGTRTWERFLAERFPQFVSER